MRVKMKLFKELNREKPLRRGYKSSLAGIIGAGIISGSALLTSGCETAPYGTSDYYMDNVMMGEMGAIGYDMAAQDAASKGDFGDARAFSNAARSSKSYGYVNSQKANISAQREAAQIQAQAMRDAATVISKNANTHKPQKYIDESHLSNVERMKLRFRNKDFTIFVCNDVVDLNNNKNYEPEEFLGINGNERFYISEKITIGNLNYGCQGRKITLKLITPSGREIEHNEITPKNGHVFKKELRVSEKELGTNTLAIYKDGGYIGKREFEIVE